MKKIAFALTLCCMILARTFTADAETRWGIVAVGNYSNLKFNQDLISVDKGFGGGAGLMGEIIIPGIGTRHSLPTCISGNAVCGVTTVLATKRYATTPSTFL